MISPPSEPDDLNRSTFTSEHFIMPLFIFSLHRLPAILLAYCLLPGTASADDTVATRCSESILSPECASWKVSLLGWADNWSELAAIGQIIGAAAAVLTLIGLFGIFMQIRSEKIALKTQTSWTIYTVSIEVLKTLLDKPHLRPYFYDNKQLPAAPLTVEQEKIRDELFIMMEIAVDHWENIYFSKDSLDNETITVWEKYMRGIYRKSPELRKFLLPEREGYRYSKDFLGLIAKEDPAVPEEQDAASSGQQIPAVPAPTD